MRTLVLDPPTAGLDGLLERRHHSGLDRLDEVLIVDPDKRSVDWLGLTGDKYKPIERSALIDLGPSELHERIDWPESA